MRVDIVIPTYKPDEKFIKLIDRLVTDMSENINRIFVINTEEALWDKAVSSEWVSKYEHLRVFHIKREEFDHARTRHEGFLMTETPYVLFMTQDAVPYDNNLLKELIKALDSDEDVAVAYARQLPDDNCNKIERLTRDFNYPDTSVINSKEDIECLGIKTFFCSNVCAMYKKDIYMKLNGFDYPAIFNEDMVYAGHAVNAGYKIAYVAEAKVIHSHNYTGREQFHRNFDLGVSQTCHPEVFEGIKSESEGVRMVIKNACALLRRGAVFSIIKLVWLSGNKYLGYKKGRNYKALSREKIMKYTMNPGYWNHISEEKS